MFTNYKPSGKKRTEITELSKYTLVFNRMYTIENKLVCHHIQNNETEKYEASFTDYQKAVESFEKEYIDFVYTPLK
jgi:hypothetical protein